MIKRKMNIKVKKSTEVMAKLSLGNAMNILRQTKVNRNLNRIINSETTSISFKYLEDFCEFLTI